MCGWGDLPRLVSAPSDIVCADDSRLEAAPSRQHSTESPSGPLLKANKALSGPDCSVQVLDVCLHDVDVATLELSS